MPYNLTTEDWNRLKFSCSSLLLWTPLHFHFSLKEMTAASTFFFPATTTKVVLSLEIDGPAGWVSSQGLRLSLKSQSQRPQTSEVAPAVWSLLFSTIAHYDLSMLRLDTIPIWLCEGDLARAVTVFIAAWFDNIVVLSPTEDGVNALFTSLFIKLHLLLLQCIEKFFRTLNFALQ